MGYVIATRVGRVLAGDGTLVEVVSGPDVAVAPALADNPRVLLVLDAFRRSAHELLVITFYEAEIPRRVTNPISLTSAISRM